MNLLAWRDGLAPGHARSVDGELLLGGIPVRTLAREYGTPLVSVDFDAMDAAIAEFQAACAPHDIEIAYAGKALLLTGLARHLKQQGVQLDVCSLGEIATAERADFPAERMTLHGCGKPDEELEAVVAGRVGTIVVDSVEEILRLGEFAGRFVAHDPVRVVLRVNTGIEAHTHEFLRTGGNGTKFGVPAPEFDAAIAAFRGARGLRFAGLHSHIGSQIYEIAAFVENVRLLVECSKRFADSGLHAETLIVGGGFGVQNDPAGDPTVPVASVINAIAGAAREAAVQAGLPVPRVGIEPGRALVARAGTSIYRVMARKRQLDRTFVVVDGSLADNPRPALYDAYHHITPAWLQSGRSPDDFFEATVCGRSCENDVLGYARLPESLRAGDLVATCTTGSYTYSMASNYNRFAKPAVVALQNGTHRPLARRQTIDDVLTLDVD